MIPLALIALVGGLGFWLYRRGGRAVPSHPPDGGAKTGWTKVDAILPALASKAGGVPLGLLVGWVARESGGDLGAVSSAGERGYFQLSPDEMKQLGLDPQRVSSDSGYSIDGGLQAIAKLYRPVADALGVAEPGTAYYWRLVKLAHTIGSGGAKKAVGDAKAAGRAQDWATLESYAVAHASDLQKALGEDMKKWFPFMDSVYDAGVKFGFGVDAPAKVVVAGRRSGLLWT